ncbi:MAG: prepilin-type N-terminal cleavage/methylation domain-containing protein [Wenzhouxiangellaceae bacterium]|nr:prepilin-type N-terminal cleavage/methylation domain-containing protein [Wenzhouxiangellaceae bacterium]
MGRRALGRAVGAASRPRLTASESARGRTSYSNDSPPNPSPPADPESRVPSPGPNKAAATTQSTTQTTARVPERPASPESRVPSPGSQAGFTLVELLLATTLIALIMAMAYGGFRAGVRATTSGEALIEETNRLRIVHQFVRRQISQARPLIIEQNEDEIIRFEGERERIRFVAPMPGYLSYGGPYVQELRLERGEVGMDLVFAFALLNGYEPGDLNAEPPVTLLEDVGRADFEFLGFTEDREAVEWTDFWDRPEEIPLAISLRLGMERDNGLFWPELVVPVVIDSGGAVQVPRTAEDIRARLLGRGNRR